MNHVSHYIKRIWIIVSSVFLVFFLLLSVDILLPLKWQFPFWRLSPHLTTKKVETAQGLRVDYVNRFGKVTIALNKNYATVLKTLDQDGNSTLEQYFDNQGKPAVLTNGNSALRREYNADGQWITSTYLDPSLNPIISKLGYATMRRTFNEFGKVETQMYYDANDVPVLGPNKCYGVRYNYNEKGLLTAIISLNADGIPMNNSDHYAIRQRSFTDDGKLYMELFFDENSNPARLRDGSYGYLYENGVTFCIDRDGHKIFVLRTFLLRSMISVLIIGILLILLIMVSNKVTAWILLIPYLAFIIYMTVINRETGTDIATLTLPPNYYLFFTNKEIASNIWLFIPLGAILYKVSHNLEIIVIPVILTFVIEISQLILGIGAFELADLIANSLGGFIGALSCYLLEPFIKRIINTPAKSSSESQRRNPPLPS